MINQLDEMTGMLFPLAGAAEPQPRMSSGAGLGLREEKPEQLQGREAQNTEQLSGSDGVRAGKRQTHPTALRKEAFGPFLAESRLSHRLLAASLIFPS